MMRTLSVVWHFMVCVLLLARGAHAQKRPAWTDDYPQIDADIAAGRPLTVLVVVPLCDSKLIACGGDRAGDPGSLDKNLYWGRAFGVRRFFDESAKQFQRVAQACHRSCSPIAPLLASSKRCASTDLVRWS